MIELGPDYDFTYHPNAADTFGDYRFGKVGVELQGKDETIDNVLGRAHYIRFKVSDKACFGFTQGIDRGDASLVSRAGRRRINGYYCGADPTPIPLSVIRDIVTGLGVRDVAAPKVSAVMVDKPANKPLTDLPITGSWENFIDAFSGTLSTDSTTNSGRIWVRMPAEKGDCAGTWKWIAGKHGGPTRPHGTWSILCANGRQASGTYTSRAPGQVDGMGRDGDDNSVMFEIGG